MNVRQYLSIWEKYKSPHRCYLIQIKLSALIEMKIMNSRQDLSIWEK